MIKVNRKLLNILMVNAKRNSRSHLHETFTVCANQWGRLTMGTRKAEYPWFIIAIAEDGELTETSEMSRIEAGQ